MSQAAQPQVFVIVEVLETAATRPHRMSPVFAGIQV